MTYINVNTKLYKRTTAFAKEFMARVNKMIRKRADNANLALLGLLFIVSLLVLNRGIFRGSGVKNFEIFISAAITGLVAVLAILIPLRQQKQSATRTFIMMVSSELYRNLDELEYAKQQLTSVEHNLTTEYNTESLRDQQSVEMGKIIGMSARLEAALEDASYSGMISSRIIADIEQSVAQAIVLAYAGVASVKKSTKHWAIFFENFFEMERAGINPELIKSAREKDINQAIQMVKEDVNIAIGQGKEAVTAMQSQAKYYRQGFKPLFRDTLINKYDCNNKAKTRKHRQSED